MKKLKKDLYIKCPVCDQKTLIVSIFGSTCANMDCPHTSSKELSECCGKKTHEVENMVDGSYFFVCIECKCPCNLKK